MQFIDVIANFDLLVPNDITFGINKLRLAITSVLYKFLQELPSQRN